MNHCTLVELNRFASTKTVQQVFTARPEMQVTLQVSSVTLTTAAYTLCTLNNLSQLAVVVRALRAGWAGFAASLFLHIRYQLLLRPATGVGGDGAILGHKVEGGEALDLHNQASCYQWPVLHFIGDPHALYPPCHRKWGIGDEFEAGGTHVPCTRRVSFAYKEKIYIYVRRRAQGSAHNHQDILFLDANRHSGPLLHLQNTHHGTYVGRWPARTNWKSERSHIDE